MKAGSVKKNHQCRSQPELVTKPRRAQTNQIVCFLNQQIINCNTGGQKTTQWAKKGVTKNQIFTKLLLVKEGQNNFNYWWSRNHAVCKEIWPGEPLEPSRTINESTGGHKTTQCEKKLSMQPTAREFSAFQANSIKDSKTLLIMKAGSVKKTINADHSQRWAQNHAEHKQIRLYVFSTNK